MKKLLLSIIFLGTNAYAQPHIACHKIPSALRNVSENKECCGEDSVCQTGMKATLLYAENHFKTLGEKGALATSDIMLVLKTASLQAQALCGKHYATKGGRRQCHQGAHNAALLVANALGLNEKGDATFLPTAPPFKTPKDKREDEALDRFLESLPKLR